MSYRLSVFRRPLTVLMVSLSFISGILPPMTFVHYYHGLTTVDFIVFGSLFVVGMLGVVGSDLLSPKLDSEGVSFYLFTGKRMVRWSEITGISMRRSLFLDTSLILSVNRDEFKIDVNSSHFEKLIRSLEDKSFKVPAYKSLGVPTFMIVYTLLLLLATNFVGYLLIKDEVVFLF